MIPRYSRAEAAEIWSAQTRYRIWFEIEAHAADAMAELGVIPRLAAKTIWEKGGEAVFDPDRIDEIERTTKHDVISFLTHVAEIVGPEARFLHQGMTSSDVLDTCLGVQLARATDLLLEDVDLVLAALKRRALEHRLTPVVGRSHGIHAEPTTFGVKLAGHYAEFVRARLRLERAREEIAVCAISGAVGTFANVDPRVEAHVAKALGLAIEPVSTQTIPRDRHAAYFAALAVVASSVERLVVYPQNMRKNLDLLGGLVHSQRVLLALTQKGMGREEAYAAVQSNAMKVWRGEGKFLDLLKAEPEVRQRLTDAELAELFDDAYHFKHVDTIFGRVFGEAADAAQAAE